MNPFATSSVRSTIKQITSLVLCSALYTSCAKQVTPTGGEEDLTPPRIVKSKPLNESIRYSGQEISLEFDEFVQLKNASKEVIVSPPLKYPLEFTQKGKKLNIEWKDTLRENTTYLFQFGASIVDLNEANPLDSNVFVFSTGDYIDSFELKGSAISSEDLSPMKDVWVMLYRSEDDSMPYQELPDYFAKTNEQGIFNFQYLQSGEYSLFALKPDNAGYLFDIPEEQIGFLKERIHVGHPTDSSRSDSTFRLALFTQDDSTQYVKRSFQLNNNAIGFRFNRPVDTLCIRSMSDDDSTRWQPKWNEDRDSVIYWFNAPRTYDSLRVEIIYAEECDTILFRKPRQSSRKGGKKTENEQVLALKSTTVNKHPHFEHFVAQSETPLVTPMDFSKLFFIEQTDTIDASSFVNFSDSEFQLNYPWKPNTMYTLMLVDSFVCDRFNRCNDSILWNFTTSRKEDYGQLHIAYKLPNNGHPFVWQMFNATNELVDEQLVNEQGKFNYEFLVPGKYRIKLVYDKNGNGKWDTGYYPAKRQPESIKFFNEEIEIRSNWLSEYEWNLKE